MAERSRTEDQSKPRAAPIEARGKPALIAAYPTPRALPLPRLGCAVGREWLEEHGVVDPKASRDHLQLTGNGSRLHVIDAGSRNGTVLNGARLAPQQPAPLDDGAIVRLGNTLLVYRAEFTGAMLPDPPLGGLVSPFGLRDLRGQLQRLSAARGAVNVLIEGETGTGKELVAAAVARQLGRAERYVAINVTGIPSGVFDSQLFGYVAGAFSGGGKGSPGVFVAHDGGAVFLDEIGELPLELQPKLLRLLENHEVFPIGATRAVNINVSVIAATNRSLADGVTAGTFRRDLLARLSGERIDIPPLRERAEDIFAIVASDAESHGRPLDLANVEVEAVERLMLHPWLSNVRELLNAARNIASRDDPGALHAWSVDSELGPAQSAPFALTRDNVEEMLQRCGQNESEAARRLGIKRGRLRRLLSKFG